MLKLSVLVLVLRTLQIPPHPPILNDLQDRIHALTSPPALFSLARSPLASILSHTQRKAALYTLEPLPLLFIPQCFYA